MNRRDIFKVFGGAAAIPAIKSVDQIEIGADDVIVFSAPGYISPDVAERIKETVKTGWNGRFKDTPVMVLSDGLQVEVMRVPRRSQSS